MGENSKIFSEQEQRIDRIIRNEKEHIIHGLILINLDNFYEINNRFGVIMGDEVLDSVDDLLRSFFRGTDIATRIKGDEFAILVRNPKTVTDVENICSKILKSISSLQFEEYVLTASIGIAVFPFHGNNYEELRTKAYQALKRAKSNGKNCYRLYDSALTKVSFSNFIFGGDYYDFDYRKLDEKDWDRYFIDVSLQLFHYEPNIYSCINSLLEIFCTYHGLSRSFISTDFEHSEHDDRLMNFTMPGYEVDYHGVIRLLRLDLISRMYEEFDDFGYVSVTNPAIDPEIMNYMSDTGAKEILYFTLKRNDTFAGAAVFENLEDGPSRITADKLNKLYNQVNAFFSFALLSKEYRASKELLSKIEMFEGMQANIYIIDYPTQTIEYMNEAAVSAAGISAFGKKCYEILQNSACQCEDCPVKNMDISDSRANGRKECINHSTCKWSTNLYSWVSGRDNKGKLLLISVDLDEMFSVFKN